MKPLEYQLPAEKIADRPKNKRVDSKLLIYNKGEIMDNKFSNLPLILDEKYDLVLNETKVVNARIHFSKPSGGKVEVFCLEPMKGDVTEMLAQKEAVEWNCLIGGAKKWKEGEIYCKTTFNESELILTANKIDFKEGVFGLNFKWSNPQMSFSEILEVFGEIPLPPYIKRDAESSDLLRYQTVFAKNEGSVAAPTASLHFNEDILNSLAHKGVNFTKVNLHVGAGTFKPISGDVESHEMHHELFEVQLSELEKLSLLKNLIAVGTTSVRTLESLYLLAQQLSSNELMDLSSPQKIDQWEWKESSDQFQNHHEAFELIVARCKAQKIERVYGYTSLMIIPGFTFKVVKGLITNFHMPKSTLLFLVSAFIGTNWETVYQHALDSDYRFLSYGDSSLLIP